LCDKSYPKKLAFAFLEELQKEFQEKYGPEVGTVSRPYAFVKFGTLILFGGTDVEIPSFRERKNSTRTPGHKRTWTD
jgi:hypothetical protein